MAAADITTQERIEFLEAALDFFRQQLAATDPERGFDSRKRYRQLVTAINKTRADLVCARLESDWPA